MQKFNNKKHVVIVDDDRAATAMLRLLLETRGYEVDVASRADEALSQVKAETDLVLLDLILPDMEGFSFCRKLKENPCTMHVPIIILSGKRLSEDIVEGLYLGADDYLVKPFEYEELVARMEAVMRRGSIFHKEKLATLAEDDIIRELRKIIHEGLVVPFFQPIVALDSMSIIGVEALCRAQTKTVLSNPELLFKAAFQFGLYYEMELVAWNKAIAKAAKFLDKEKLFLNCNPHLVESQKFLTIKSLFEDAHILPENVVLEITERAEVKNFKLFYEHLSRYRENGFSFAVDDVGGGYASLESIVETKPEVVKIDRHIISGVGHDVFKSSIVKFIVSFCRENKILSIAEGIESKEEFETVRSLEVDAVQGYYFCRPSNNLDIPEVNDSLAKL